MQQTTINVAALKVSLIFLDEITLRDDNRDKIDAKAIKELAKSMELVGQLSPVILVKRQDKYECIAGERRIRAAKQLQWKALQARVLSEDTPEEMLEQIRLIENLQRVDLTPWEEAEQIAKLSETTGQTVTQIAALIGKVPQYVAVRLAYTKIIPALRKIISKNNWPLTYLPKIARLAEGSQELFIQELPRYIGHMDYPTPHTLDEMLRTLLSSLAQAPFDLDDATLVPDAGSCTACTKRSNAQRMLFSDDADDKKRPDRCLDRQCYQKKEATHVELSLARLREKHERVLLVSNLFVPEHIKPIIGDASVERLYDHSTVSKTTPNAIPALCVGGDKLGKVLYLASRSAITTGTRAKRPIDEETGKPVPMTAKERLKLITLKRKLHAIEQWKERLPKMLVCDTIMIRLAACFGTMHRADYLDDAAWKNYARIEKQNMQDVALWHAVSEVLISRLKRTLSIEMQTEHLWKEAVNQATVLDSTSTLDAMLEDAEKAIPLPASLKKKKGE